MRDLLIKLFEGNPWRGAMSASIPAYISPFNHVIVETESEDLATYEKAVVQFEQNFPERLFETFHELESSGFHEMWTLAYERRVGG